MAETVWFNVRELGRETDKAVLVEIDGLEIWLPKSQLKARKKSPSGSLQRVEITTWFAKKSGLKLSASDAPYVAPSGDKVLWVACQLLDETFTVYSMQIAGRVFEIPKSEVLKRLPETGPIHRLCVLRAWAEEHGLLDPKDDL